MRNLSEVTIGVPAFNEEKYIEQSINSALLQNCDIIIGDNASSDRTPEICRNYQSIHNNITYIRHEKNIGSWGNFQTLVNATTTPYFMWLGAHDFIGERLVSTLSHSLSSDESMVGAFGRFSKLDYSEPTNVCSNLFSPSARFLKGLLSDDPAERIYAMVTSCPHCVIIHSLFRTSALRVACANVKPHLGCDLTVLARLSKLGKISQGSRETYVYRDQTATLVEQQVDPIERWIQSLNPPDSTYRVTGYGYMRRAIYYSFRDIPKPKGGFSRLRRSILGRLLRRHLNKRFGPFVYP